MPVQRYKLTIAYRGTRYHGWQSQPDTPAADSVAAAGPASASEGGATRALAPAEQGGAGADAEAGPSPAPLPPPTPIPTVQATLKRVLGEVVGHPVYLIGSSRTDSGVHAKGQIAHFDTDRLQIPPGGIRRAANARLPSDILIRKIEPVPDTFDAVRSTVSKRYQYSIWNSQDRPVFFPDLAWHRWQWLDVPKIVKAASYFVGEHDFASFARPGPGREHTVRTVFACDVSFRSPKLIIAVEGSGFLWNMVRIMVGTLVEVGMGRQDPDAIPGMLTARDRRAAGPTAPPHGLYLQWIRMKPAPAEASPPSASRVDAPEGPAPVSGVAQDA